MDPNKETSNNIIWTNGRRTQENTEILINLISFIDLNSFGTAATTGLLYQPQSDR
jgi:hypothetical protein